MKPPFQNNFTDVKPRIALGNLEKTRASQECPTYFRESLESLQLCHIERTFKWLLFFWKPPENPIRRYHDTMSSRGNAKKHQKFTRKSAREWHQWRGISGTEKVLSLCQWKRYSMFPTAPQRTSSFLFGKSLSHSTVFTFWIKSQHQLKSTSRTR